MYAPRTINMGHGLMADRSAACVSSDSVTFDLHAIANGFNDINDLPNRMHDNRGLVFPIPKKMRRLHKNCNRFSLQRSVIRLHSHRSRNIRWTILHWAVTKHIFLFRVCTPSSLIGRSTLQLQLPDFVIFVNKLHCSELVSRTL